MATHPSPQPPPVHPADLATGDSGGDRPSADLTEVVGYHIRMFRKDLGLSLRGLAERSGLSIGFLSQLERGRTSIGLTTLRELAATLGHEITEFFDEAALHADRSTTDDPPVEVISTVAGAARDSAADSGEPQVSGERQVSRYFTLTRASGENSSDFISGKRTYRLLSNRAAGVVLEPMLISIAPGGIRGEMEVHSGEEFAYVLQGEISYTVDGVEYRLRAGDSVHLLSTIPHSLHNDTDEMALVVSVVTPRLF
jgi:quercetin dioxygenase-like cupin family protein